MVLSETVYTDIGKVESHDRKEKVSLIAHVRKPDTVHIEEAETRTAFRRRGIPLRRTT